MFYQVYLRRAVTGTTYCNILVGNSRVVDGSMKFEQEPWLRLDFPRIEVRAAILKAAGNSAVCKDLLVHVEMNWDKIGQRDFKRGVDTRTGEQMVQLEWGMMAWRATLWPQQRVEVTMDLAAATAIYSWYISDYLNVMIHNAGLAVWHLISPWLIRVCVLLWAEFVVALTNLWIDSSKQ